MKKRIVFYGVNHYPPRGGTSTVVENLILQLKDKYDLTVYCYRHPDAENHIAGVKTVQFRPVSKGSLGSFMYFFAAALHLLFLGRADLVHAHKTDCAVFLPLLRLRFKVIATSHEAPYKRDKWNALQKAYFRLAESFFIFSPNICTSISKPLAEYYKWKYKRPVRFIPNGINAINERDFDYEGARSFLPRGMSPEDDYILFAARRLMATKGAHTMLDALQKIDYRGPVLIAGELDDTPYLRHLRAQAKSLNVYFLDFVHPLHTLMALVKLCRFFVFPSETEGMSVMLMEAASAGRPIIASDIPENTQVFSEKEVLFFNSSDPADLADKINVALSDPPMMAALGSKAQKHVFTHYLWSDIAWQYDQLYQQVTNNTAL
jgi:glycosyltransferase involved in cell wall biosynthesis